MVPPGRIIHLVTTQSQKSKSILTKTQETYAAVWAGSHVFDEIQLSSKSLANHMAPSVGRALESIAETFGLESPTFLPPTVFEVDGDACCDIEEVTA